MQRIISIWLLSLIFLPISSKYIAFKFRQQHVRKEIKHHIKSGVTETELVLLKIPVALEENPTKDFKRMHAREFRYKGNMYDVVKLEIRGDTTWYWCIWDQQETVLFTNLNELVNQAMGNNPAQQADEERLVKFMYSLYLATHTSTNHSIGKII